MDLLYQVVLYETDTIDKILDNYTESMTALISDIENSELIRSTYFTESSKASEKEKTKESDNRVNIKVKEGINRIFGTNLDTITTGSIPKKINKQLSELKEIKKKIDDSDKSDVKIGKIEITVPNLWVYQKFIEDVVLSHVEKFTIDKSLKFFDRVSGTGRTIDRITSSIIAMTDALKKGRTDVVRRTDKEMSKIAGKNATLMSTTRFVDASDIPERKPRSLNVNVRNVDKFDDDGDSEDDYNESFDDSDASAVFCGAVLLAAMGFSICFGSGIDGDIQKPEKIHLQKATINGIYNQIMNLHPEKFVDRISRISKNAAASLGTKSNIAGFQVTIGTPGVVSYANKINKLIKAYAIFYIALIDFYIRMMKDGIKLES